MVVVISSHSKRLSHTFAGKKTLREVRQFYFKLKDEIFGNSKTNLAFDTKELEGFLQDAFGDMTMNSVKYPR